MRELDAETLFKQHPTHWGLRGDPFLWQELEDTFRKEGLPPTEEEFFERLYHYFEVLIGEKAERTGEGIYVRRYDAGGLSRGNVSPNFWIDKGFIFLIKRFKEIRPQ